MSVIEKKQAGKVLNQVKWTKRIDVNDFIAENITPYYGSDEFWLDHG